jgi:hypothetical protein
MVASPSSEELLLPTGGACMRPWIWPGGQLRVRRCQVDELCVGDIAVWFDGRRVLSHRVVRLVPGGFVTRGDLCLERDPASQRHQLVGKAIGFMRGALCLRFDGPIGRGLGRATAWLAVQALRTRQRQNRE